MNPLTEADLVDAPEYAAPEGRPSDFLAAQPPKPSIGDTLYSAMHLGNSMVSAVDYAQTQHAQVRAGTTYDPQFDIAGYAERVGQSEYIDRYVDIKNLAQAEVERQRIEDEKNMAGILGRAGGLGTIAQIGAGVLDPINLIPLGEIAKGGSILRQGLKVGAESAAVVGVTELGMHTTQETRTAEESYWNMAGGAVLGGVLGSGVAAFKGRVGAREAAAHQQFIDEFRQAADPTQWQSSGSLSAAAPRTTTLEQEAIAPAFGLEKLDAINPVSDNPIARTRASPSVEVRRIAGDLAETPLYLKGNAEGIASPIAAESRMKAWQYPLAQSLNDVKGSYAEYVTRLRKEGGGKPISYGDFREQVSMAARRSDAHEIPEVGQASKAMRERLLNPLKEEAVHLGLLPEDVEVTTAESYLTRLYDKDKIAAGRNDFIKRLSDQFEIDQLRSPEKASRAEIEAQAEEITNNILGSSEARTQYDITAGPRGPLKERTLNVPDAVVEPYLVNDIERVLRTYARTMAADVELARSFGRPDMADQIAKIGDDYDRLARKTQDGPAQAALLKRRKKDISDIEAMRDRVRGTYALPSNPQGLAVRTGRFARNLNFVRQLGGMTVSSLPDVASVQLTHGLSRVMGTGAKMLMGKLTGARGIRLAAEEVRLSGTALDMVLHSRTVELNDVFADLGRYSKAERGMEWITAKMGRLSLMDHWNSAMKQLAGLTTQTRMLQAMEGGDHVRLYRGEPPHDPAMVDPGIERGRYFTEDPAKAQYYAGKKGSVSYVDVPAGRLDELAPKGGAYATVKERILPRQLADTKQPLSGAPAVARGKIAPAELRRLRMQGITEEMAGRISAEFKKHGTKDSGVWSAGTAAWTDREAASAFRAGLVKEVDRIIVTPGQEKPLWMSTEWGKTIGQFKSFTFSSMSRTMIHGLQQRDLNTLQGFISMTGLGMLSVYLKAKLSGHDLPADPGQWIAAGVDASGIASWIFEANNISQKTTGVGLLTSPQRYASRSGIESLLGPSAGLANDLITVARDSSGSAKKAVGMGGEKTPSFTASDVKRVRRLIPFNNLFYLRWLFDAAEKGADDAMGLERRH